MKISFCPSAGVPSRSAESIFVVKMCEALAKPGHDVTLFSPKTPDRDQTIADIYEHYGVEPNFTIEPVVFPRAPMKRVISALASVLKARRLKVDLFYTRSIYACFVSVHLGLRTVFEIHSPVGAPGDFDSKLLRRIVRHKNLERIVVITRALKHHLEENYPIPPGVIIVVPDAADIPTTKERLEISDPNRLQVGYVGHLYPGRGIDVIAELARRRPEMDFHCVGGMEADIEFWSKEMSAVENFHLHGYVPFSETEKFRLSCDVLTAPYMRKVSIYGNDDTDTAAWMSPMKVFEYMAAHKPIVTSDLPAIREVLTHEQDSVLCDPDNIDEWEAALVRLQQDVTFRDRLASRAYETFLANYTWDARANIILASLEMSSSQHVTQ